MSSAIVWDATLDEIKNGIFCLTYWANIIYNVCCLFFQWIVEHGLALFNKTATMKCIFHWYPETHASNSLSVWNLVNICIKWHQWGALLGITRWDGYTCVCFWLHGSLHFSFNVGLGGLSFCGIGCHLSFGSSYVLCHKVRGRTSFLVSFPSWSMKTALSLKYFTWDTCCIISGSFMKSLIATQLVSLNDWMVGWCGFHTKLQIDVH